MRTLRLGENRAQEMVDCIPSSTRIECVAHYTTRVYQLVYKTLVEAICGCTLTLTPDPPVPTPIPNPSGEEGMDSGQSAPGSRCVFYAASVRLPKTKYRYASEHHCVSPNSFRSALSQ